jgi:hypothetical protein
MGSPEVPIDVDPETGIWRTDGLPMIYLPRHFLVNNHVAVEEALGRDTYREILRAATEKSALHWCRAESKTHGLTPGETFRHYFKRLSQRGWGQFSVDRLDASHGLCRISLRNSLFTLESAASSPAPRCYMFEGFVTGAFRFVAGGEGVASEPHSVSCSERQCAGDQLHDHCIFDIH